MSSAFSEEENRASGAFQWRVWEAVKRILAMVVFLVLHEGLDLLLKRTFPAGVFQVLHAFSVAAFSIIYIFLLYETVRVFVEEDVQDWIRRWRNAKGGGDARGAG